jgi:hypothetical protein
MNKKIILLILFIFLSSNVFALGVTPARTTLDFEPNMKKNLGFNVINSGGKDIKVLFSTQGDLAQYITLQTKEAVISSSENSKFFNYELNLPKDLSPGLHTGGVFIIEVPAGTSQAETQVLATLAVVTQVYVYVPYPGKYANAKMIVYNANQGEDVTFVFSAVSAGEFDLTSVRANVEIFNKMGEKVDGFSTSSIAIPSGQKKEIVYKWKADVPIGEYRAVGTFIYDEGSINLEEIFSIGSKDLELKEIKAKNFRLGQIVKLEMLVENKWSEPITGAYIETKIKDAAGSIISSFQSPSQNIDALSTKLFNSYWDTAGVRVGTYETEVSINYADKSSKKNLKFQVEENELTIIGLGYVVSAEKSGNRDTLITVLIIVIVLLVLINILWFMIFRKRFKKK